MTPELKEMPIPLVKLGKCVMHHKHEHVFFGIPHSLVLFKVGACFHVCDLF